MPLTELQVLQNCINEIPLRFDPCPLCAYINKDKTGHKDNIDVCEKCCWYYGSKFKLSK